MGFVFIYPPHFHYEWFRKQRRNTCTHKKSSTLHFRNHSSFCWSNYAIAMTTLHSYTLRRIINQLWHFFSFVFSSPLCRYVHLWLIWHRTICGLIGWLSEWINRFIGLALCSQFDFYGLSHIKWLFFDSIYVNWFAIYSISCALLTIFCSKCIRILRFARCDRCRHWWNVRNGNEWTTKKTTWTWQWILIAMDKSDDFECCFTILIRG